LVSLFLVCLNAVYPELAGRMYLEFVCAQFEVSKSLDQPHEGHVVFRGASI